ncbi:WSSV497 [White spot syndrome virus]|uniref:WSSV497 n=1 Tax=White spot syndrome virus TaxID=342409 RepID=A0A2I6SCG1_9VIRU|nr:WSSV497 [White spot syndrome virus]
MAADLLELAIQETIQSELEEIADTEFLNYLPHKLASAKKLQLMDGHIFLH